MKISLFFFVQTLRIFAPLPDFPFKCVFVLYYIFVWGMELHGVSTVNPSFITHPQMHGEGSVPSSGLWSAHPSEGSPINAYTCLLRSKWIRGLNRRKNLEKNIVYELLEKNQIIEEIAYMYKNASNLIDIIDDFYQREKGSFDAANQVQYFIL